MPRYERVQPLKRLLSEARQPLTMLQLCTKLTASRATVNRLIAFLRDHEGQDIRYDRDSNGYRLHKAAGATTRVELSGNEVASLLEAIAILEQIPPGLLRRDTREQRSGLQRLREQYLGNGRVADRVRLRLNHARPANPKGFGAMLDALRAGRRVEFQYRTRGTDESGVREVSPVRLTLYRGSWYVAGWCHTRGALRLFSLDRILGLRRLDTAAYEPPAKLVTQELDSSYGIFTGEANRKAVLLFDPVAARWVADEEWHPDARVELQVDGSVRLIVPYRNETELVMEILRHGPRVVVQSPVSLRRSVAKALRDGARLYAAEDDSA